MSKDPPPDLVIEIDIAHSSLDKMNLYTTLGIPEIWRYDGERISFYYLIDGEYQEQEASVALPEVTSEVATQFIENSHDQAHSSLLRSVREWAQSHKP